MCLDADVIIYAAESGHPLGERILGLLDTPHGGPFAGSVLLVPETLSQSIRMNPAEADAIAEVLVRLELHVVDHAVADLAASLGASYRLRAPDAIHLATAVWLGADRFVTNNRRDFDRSVAEVEVVFPEDLPEPA